MRTRALRRPTNPAVLQYFLLAASALLTSSLASPAGIVDRAEATELRLSDGKLQPRVVRDEEGHIISLTLSDMKLSSDEVAELGTLEHLSSLVLFRTNFTDADLAHLKTCKTLAHLNLTGTEVTDRAIDTLLEFKTLRTVCLGDVNIAPQSVEKLRHQTRAKDQGLRWGYSQRKR